MAKANPAREKTGRSAGSNGSGRQKSSGNTSKGIKSAESAFRQANSATNPVVQGLRVQVANGMILYMNYKHYHWQVFGPHFRDLHLMFDEFAAETIAAVDEFAERVRMIGQNPPFDPAEMIEIATVSRAARVRSEHRPNLREMLAEADANLLGLILEMRDAAHEADEARDPGTADLYARTVQIFEKQEWYLRDILERGDGLA